MAAIRNKYRGVTFMKAADLPELKGEGLVKAGVQELVNCQEVLN